MDVVPPFVPPGAAAVWKLTEATKWQTAATLASSIIMASGRPHSIQQALDIARSIQFAMFPVPNDPAYKEWETTKGTSLNEVHGPS
jgi:hypothetical protein